MKRHILLLATLAFLAYPYLCYSSFLVELKNGRKIVVSHYWNEGSRIMFYAYGGAVRISRDYVEKIMKTDVIVENRKEIISELLHPKTPDVLPVGENRTNVGDQTITDKNYLKKKYHLENEMAQALEGFRSASGSKDLKAKKEAIASITRVSGELVELESEMKSRNNSERQD